MAHGYKDNIDLKIFTKKKEYTVKSGEILHGDMNELEEEFSKTGQNIYNNPKYIERLQDSILSIILHSDYVWLNERDKIKTENIESISLIVSNDLRKRL